MRRTPPNDSLVISYLTLRKAIGFIGVALPFVLVLGNILIFHARAIEDSISYYYYTHMRGVLVGSLWSIGIFLFSYRGYETRDEVAGRLGCVFALGVALFPTARDKGACDILHLSRVAHAACDTPHAISFVHAVCATLLFLTLAYFSLFLFTETHPSSVPGQIQPMTRRKRERNAVYYVCGFVILASIAAILILHIAMGIKSFGPVPVLFLFESIAVEAFGISWLVKGEFILKE